MTAKKTRYQEQRDIALKFLGIPKDIDPDGDKDVLQSFFDASLLVAEARKFAVAKALRGNKKLVQLFHDGEGTQNQKIRLKPQDVENLENTALKHMDRYIRECAQSEPVPGTAYDNATNAFNSEGSDRQRAKISTKLRTVLADMCIFPEGPDTPEA